MRIVAPVALLLLLALAASTGCTRVELAFQVNEDGSGTFAYTFAHLGGTPEPSDYYTFSDPLYDVPEYATIEPFEEQGVEGPYEGFTASVDVDDMTDTTLWQDAWLEELQDIAFTENAGAWQFYVVIPAFLDEPIPPGELSEMSDEERRLLRDSYFRIRVELPGHVVEHNADRVENGALVWELDQLAATERELSARTTAGRPWWTYAPAVTVGIYAVVAALAVYAARQMGRSGRPGLSRSE